MRIAKTTTIAFDKETEMEYAERASEILSPKHWTRTEDEKDITYENVEALVLPAEESTLFRKRG
jgi:hypothetical protein